MGYGGSARGNRSRTGATAIPGVHPCQGLPAGLAGLSWPYRPPTTGRRSTPKHPCTTGPDMEWPVKPRSLSVSLLRRVPGRDGWARWTEQRSSTMNQADIRGLVGVSRTEPHDVDSSGEVAVFVRGSAGPRASATKPVRVFSSRSWSHPPSPVHPFQVLSLLFAFACAYAASSCSRSSSTIRAQTKPASSRATAVAATGVCLPLATIFQ